MRVPRRRSPEQVSLPLLLARAGRYVDEFLDRLTNVVAEETYQQDSSARVPAFIPSLRGNAVAGLTAATSRHRTLKSDFLLVHVQGSSSWVPFRDVYEVDGIPVRDREQRVAKLFLKPSDDLMEQAIRIKEESARFNLGDMVRTMNEPVLALLVIETSHQPRFEFFLGKQDRSMGPNVWVVDFKEEGVPTIVAGPGGMPLFSHGRLWIEASGGRLVRSEMRIDQPRLLARVVTTFRRDEHFGIDVPFQMEESYVSEGGARLTAKATYGRFRRFDVSTDEQVNVEPLKDETVNK